MDRKFRLKIGCAVVSGLLLTASFPPGRLDWMAWLALVPLLWSLKNETPVRAFKLGLVTGFAHYLTLIYWIVVVLKHYGGLPFVVSLGVLIIFCIYLSLYPALFSYLIIRFKGFRLSVFTVAAVWVGLEYLRANFLSGFPWCLLGYSQYRHIGLIQITDLVGVYGLSFLIVLSNALLYIILFERQSIRKIFLVREVPILLFMAVFVLYYGYDRLSQRGMEGAERKSMRVAVVQGNIDQSVKWDPAYQEKTIVIYERLTRTTRPFKPNLVVWPETALPFFFQADRALSPGIIRVAVSMGTDLIFGSPAFVEEKGGVDYFNRAYALSSDGRVYGFYDKVHLVPFGEYVPFKKILPFVHRLVPAAGDFASGKEVSPLRLPDVSAGILICFEAIFPALSREQTKKGAEILVNLTNDAWFGMTSAPHQHLSMAVLRSVENRRPMVRAANTGISAMISPWGQILLRGDQFREEVLIKEIIWSAGSLSFYSLHGDLFILAMVLLVVVHGITETVKSKR